MSDTADVSEDSGVIGDQEGRQGEREEGVEVFASSRDCFSGTDAGSLREADLSDLLSRVSFAVSKQPN